MKVSGFAIARNVIKADYPIGESLKSIAPLCDELSWLWAIVMMAQEIIFWDWEFHN